MPTLRSTAVPATNMVADQMVQDPSSPTAFSPVPVTRSLTEAANTPTSARIQKTLLSEKKVINIAQQECAQTLEPLLTRIALLEGQQLLHPALLERIKNLEAQVTAVQRPDQFFTTAEVASFSTDLEPTSVPMWLEIFFLPAIGAKNWLARQIIDYDDTKWLSAQHLPEVKAAGSWLARAIKAALKRESPHVQRFYNSLLGQPSIVTCGRALVLSIRKAPMFEVGAEQDSFKESFETHAYFTEGMTTIQAKLAASQFKKDYELLAERGMVGTAPTALLTKMIDKMPPSLEKEAKDLRQDIFKAQTLGNSIFTFEQLAALIAGLVSTAPVPAANVAQGGWKCAICGKTGCNVKTCTLKCDECDMSMCPGRFQNQACVVCADAPVPATIMGVFGRPIKNDLREKLVEAHAKHHSKANGPKASYSNVLACAVASDALGDVATSVATAIDDMPRLHTT